MSSASFAPVVASPDQHRSEPSPSVSVRQSATRWPLTAGSLAAIKPPASLGLPGASCLRPVGRGDLAAIAAFPFTVSITEPLTDLATLTDRLDATALWSDDAGALAITEPDGRLVGTCQFYRSAPCIHGYEIGYLVHDRADRGRGHASTALGLLTDHIFETRLACFRLQLLIEVWNVASWKVAERGGYVREGLLRSAGFGEGDPSDCFVYGRTRKDWTEQRHAGPSLGGSASHQTR